MAIQEIFDLRDEIKLETPIKQELDMRDNSDIQPIPEQQYMLADCRKIDFKCDKELFFY